jgi:hypothetical protein
MSIFVSHSQQDEAAYSNLCRALEKSVELWDPKTMAVGQSLADQLREAIKTCDACVFLATKRSLESQWCLAELGAFWGAGKQVIIFHADPAIAAAELPAQFRELVWTSEADRVLDSVKDVSAKVPDGLTPDLVLLLRYLERDDTWVEPDIYGRALAVANKGAAEIKGDELLGWNRAVRYGLLYLSQLYLTEQRQDTTVTYSITKYGKNVLKSRRVREKFAKAFERPLIPLR